MAKRGATLLAWDHWHIEPSSICTLKCPRCPRAEVPETLLNRQLSLRFFQDQIGSDTIKQIRKITFCGNDGDPIYCREFLEICEWIKSVNPGIMLVIITNGSHKPAAWWKQLGRVLNAHDEVNWSLDGWDQSSNERYRINSDWQSIMEGYHAFRRANDSTYRVWAAIAFRFNEDHLESMRQSAQNLGFDLWQLTKSTKFGSHYPQAYGEHDLLEPQNADLIASGHRFQRSLQDISGRTRPSDEMKIIFYERAKSLDRYSGICLIGNKGVFLNSQGEFYPCCWTANRYEHNQSWHDLARSRFNLNQHTFQEILNDKFWTDGFLRFDSLECRTKCTPEQLKNLDHVTEW